MAELFTHSRWHTAKQDLDALAKHGVHIVQDDALKGMELPAIQSGEQKVGVLTAEEQTLLRALHDLQQGIDKEDRTIQGEIMRKMGDMVAASDPATSPVLMIDPSTLAPQRTPGDEEEHFAKRQTAHYLHALLHWAVGDRLGVHAWRLGFRAGASIVKVSPRGQSFVAGQV